MAIEHDGGIRCLSRSELEAGVDQIRAAPATRGRVDLIVRRPHVDQREVLGEARFDSAEGLVGDTWRERGSSRFPDGSADPQAQVTVMSSRAAALVSGGGSGDDWAIAGDQLYVDLDLSVENLPAGSRLHMGTVVLEVSAKPHTGCSKFAARYGLDAARFVNSPVGTELRLRGLNAFVVVPGMVRTGDLVEVEAPRARAGVAAGDGAGARASAPGAAAPGREAARGSAQYQP